MKRSALPNEAEIDVTNSGLSPKRRALIDKETADEDGTEVGIVEQLSLQHFMCHHFLEVTFGANVNFVIGRNGSGKSAILTALIVGLGGKAATTSRGQSIKSFVKEGHQHCTVKVRLRNRGPDAFKADHYGRSIIIERRLSTDGSSIYKIKAHNDKVVSQKKDELLAILDHFNIQIDNPVSLLTQETSRSFLSSSNERDKYRFFMKATQLEQMSHDYQQIMENKTILSDTLAKKKKTLPGLEAELKILEEKWKDVLALKDLKKELIGLKNQLLWAYVREKKQAADEAQLLLGEHQDKVPKYAAKIEECLKRERLLSKMWDDKRLCINERSEEGELLSNRKRDLQQAYASKRAEMKLKLISIKKLEYEHEATAKDRKKVLDKIEEARAAAARDLESERVNRAQQLQVKQKSMQQYQAQLATGQHELRQLDMALKRSREQQHVIRMELNSSKDALDDKRAKLKLLEANQANKLSLFGSHVADVLRDIHNQKNFHKVPLGPIGSLIKLRDEKWALGVEACLKKNITAFICHDHHDLKLLQEILRRRVQGPMPATIVSRFSDRLYNMGNARPHSSHPTVLEMLIIDNPNVANALIDLCRIETVLLIERASEAQDLLWRKCPVNAWKAISLDGYETLGGTSSKSYPSRFHHARYLKSSVEHAIRELRVELSEAETQYQNLAAELKEQESTSHRHQEELNRIRKKCVSEQDLINRIALEVQELETFEEDQAPDVVALEEELVTCDGRLKCLSQEIEKSKAEGEKIQAEIGLAEKELKKCQVQVEDLLRRLEPLKDEISKIEEDLLEAKSNRKHFDCRKDELTKLIAAYSDQYEALNAEYLSVREKAMARCEEVPCDKKVQTLESAIAKMEDRIAREERTRGNADEITKKYHAAMKSYVQAKEIIKSHNLFRKQLEKALIRREKRYDEFRKYIVIRARSYFEMLLSQRGYTGMLRFNHADETLTVEVNVEQHKGAGTKDSKSLSGGERSFSTVCFVMALWEAMEAPFRCLDEFDVFMDMLNRRISMDMLMKMASDQQNRQFIFLTPQDMSNISSNNRVRIFRLQDPDRGQQVIDFRRGK